TMSSPSQISVAARSLKFYSRSHFAVALGVAAATAVILGALVVGDSVRHSLRSLVVNRLANTDSLLHARVFLSEASLENLDTQFEYVAICPTIYFPSNSIESRKEDLTRASRVQLVAVDERFTSQLIESSLPALGEDEIALNQALATELNVSVGDEVTILVEDPSGVPSDNALGRRDDGAVSIPRQAIVAILPDDGLGGLSFVPNQTSPRNIFMSLATVQDVLECESQVNAALVLTQDGSSLVGEDLCIQLNLKFVPTIEDYGLALDRHTRVFPDKARGEESTESPSTIFDYFQLSSDQLLIDDPTSDALINEFESSEATRIMSYLINSTEKVVELPADRSDMRRALNFESFGDKALEQARMLLQPSVSIGDTRFVEGPEAQVETLSRAVPYSIVAGIDDESELALSQYWDRDIIPRNNLYAPYCYINTWLAEQLDATTGDWLQLKYYQPETVDGTEVERELRVMVAGVVPLVEPVTKYTRRLSAKYATAPTIFNDPALTPSVDGITDQATISDWDLPFPLTYKKDIKPVDDEYWLNHRLTPKIFIPYRYTSWNFLFASRFGDTTAIRFPISADADANDFESQLRQKIENTLLETRSLKGLTFTPVRQQQLAAASGTTPFDALFLSLSFFVIVAALLLVYLLFRLGLQTRNAELGILRAQGFTPKRVRSLLMSEFALVAFIGTILGILVGLLYARALIAGLESWWVGAIGTQFLQYHVTPLSIAIGSGIGFFTSMAAIFWGLGKACKVPPLQNLRGVSDTPLTQESRFSKLYLAFAMLAGLAALGLAFLATAQTGMARAGSFFGCGILALLACIFAVRHFIEPQNRSKESSGERITSSLWQMAWQSIGRNPSRSMLALGLLSVASFLIASMSVFQIAPTERGYGGFNLIGQSSQPIYRNLGSAEVREEQLGDEAKKLSGTSILPLRARFAGDASCNNLFQVAQPTILGLPDRLREIHDFAPGSIEFDWASAKNKDNPWIPLTEYATGSEDSPIPVILDQNTAMWSLKQGAAVDSIIQIEIDDQTLYFRTVGLLSNSVLQGKLVISQRNFETVFPELGGYSYFLINSGDKDPVDVVASTLESGWASEGLDIQYSDEILKAYLGVQNTYISAFQSLGALGLLLGSFGLIAVQVRSVGERRREFAVMRAVGFAQSQLASILTMETAILLVGGLLIGCLCALFALVPYILEVGPQLSLVGPILMLLGVLAIGFIASLIAVRAAGKQSVLEGLRSE
ncbi:MAG: ABC transporter permease, partial [Planctomycetota bacterium]